MKIFVKNQLQESLNSDKSFSSDRNRIIHSDRFYTVSIDADSDIRLSSESDGYMWNYLSTRAFKQAIKNGDIILINDNSL